MDKSELEKRDRKVRSEAASLLGRIGAAARTAALTGKQRSDIARKASKARWEQFRARQERLKEEG